MSWPCNVAEGTEFLGEGPGRSTSIGVDVGDGTEPRSGPGPEAKRRFSCLGSKEHLHWSPCFHLGLPRHPLRLPTSPGNALLHRPGARGIFIKQIQTYPSRNFLTKTEISTTLPALCFLAPPASLASALTQQHASWSRFHSTPILSVPQTTVSHRPAVGSVTDVSW